MRDSQRGWAEYLRFITPIGVTIGIFMMSLMLNRLDQIDDKIFKHLTNDEIHCPKSVVVTKAEFSIYQEMRQRQMVDIKDSLNQRIDSLRVSMEKVIGLLENGSQRKSSRL